jgi:hypothetical protein
MAEGPRAGIRSNSTVGAGSTGEGEASGSRAAAHLGGDLQCLSCGYNLRGLSRDGRCPECGHAVAETINRLCPWAAGARGSRVLMGSLLLGCAPFWLAGLLIVVWWCLLPAEKSEIGLQLTAVSTGCIWLGGAVLVLTVASQVPPWRPYQMRVAWTSVGYLFFCIGSVVVHVAFGTPSEVWLQGTLIVAPLAFGAVHLVLASALHRLMGLVDCGIAKEYGSVTGLGSWLLLICYGVFLLAGCVQMLQGNDFLDAGALWGIQVPALMISVGVAVVSAGATCLAAWALGLRVRGFQLRQHVADRGRGEATNSVEAADE